MARRFIAGEESDDAMRAVRRLNADGFAATLDYLGESVSDRAAADQAAGVYLGAAAPASRASRQPAILDA